VGAIARRQSKGKVLVNTRKLASMLNPKTCRFDIGRGGIPTLTPQDVAAAIGMVGDTLAREVFCAVWWPDGAALVAAELDRLIARAQFGEWKERADKLLHAQLAVATADVSGDPHDARRAKQMMDHAKRTLWPSLKSRTYASIRGAALSELRNPALCPACKGRGTVERRSLVVPCEACAETGSTPWSERARASAIGISWTPYRENGWNDVYAWTHALLSDAADRGAAIVARRIGRNAA